MTLLLSYKAIFGGLLLGVVPDQLTEDMNINHSYSLQETMIDNNDIKIEKDLELVSPVIQASSAIAIDLNSDKVLFSKDAYKKRQIASLTKLMTSILVVDNLKLNKKVKVSKNAAYVIGSNMNLYAGEELTVKSLLYGALINSANDAALALAEEVAGNEDEFVKMMNAKAKEMGLVNTHFDNSVGLDSYENYSTAFEIYLIAKEFLKYPLLREIVNLEEYKVLNSDGKEHKLKNTNKNLKSFLDISGIKTGTTDMAGKSLVNLITIDNEHEVVVVLLNSPRRFSEAKIIGEWCDRAYEWN